MKSLVLIHILILMFITYLPAALAGNTIFTPTQAEEPNIQINVDHNGTYNMFVGNVLVGIVNSPSEGLVFYDRSVEQLRASFTLEVLLEGSVHFSRKNSDNASATDVNDLIETIKAAFKVYTNAFAITLNGEVVAYLATPEEAQRVLELVKEPYRQMVLSKPDTWLEDLRILEEHSIIQARVPYDSLSGVDEALALITVGVEKANEYVVKKGDTLWDIANAHDVSVSDIKLSNPDIDDEMIHPGDILKVMDVRNLTTVFTKERHVYREETDFTTEVRKTDRLFVGQNRVVQRGERGENEVEIYIFRENGEERDREIISDKVIVEPVPRIVEQGTKPRPRPAKTTFASRGNERPSDLSPIPRDGVVRMPWFDGVEDIFHRGMHVKVTHVNTGLTFWARRFGGRFHADVEPLTEEDTNVLRRIYGGSFSWERQAIIVEIGGRRIAASMNGMPHGGELIQDNNFQGHFCIHFYGSFLHETGRRDARHQAMVRYAAGE